MKTIQITTSYQLTKWAQDNEVHYSNTNRIYHLTVLTEEEKDDIKLAFKKKLLKELKLINHPIVCANIIGIGSKSQFKPSHVSPYIGWISGPRLDATKDRPRHYRDYSKTEQEQDKVKHYVNLYEDDHASSRSLLRAIRGEYLCLWYEETIVPK